MDGKHQPNTVVFDREVLLYAYCADNDGQTTNTEKIKTLLAKNQNNDIYKKNSTRKINQLYQIRTADNTEISTLKLPMPCVARPSAAPVKT